MILTAYYFSFAINYFIKLTNMSKQIKKLKDKYKKFQFLFPFEYLI